MDRGYETLAVKVCGMRDGKNKYMTADSFRKGIDYLIAHRKIDGFTRLWIVNQQEYGMNPEIEDITAVAETKKISYAVTMQEETGAYAVYDFNWHIEKEAEKSGGYLGMPRVFVDYGAGFETAGRGEKFDFSFEEEHFSAEYVFENAPQRIKIVPSGRQYCILNGFEILTEYGRMEERWHNGVEVEQMLLFDTYNAQIIYENKYGAKQFRIKSDMAFFRSFQEYDMVDKVRNLAVKLQKAEQQLAAVSEQRKEERYVLKQILKQAGITDGYISEEEKRQHWEEYYNYSMLLNKLYPQNSDKEKCIVEYMDTKCHGLIQDYKYRPQGTLVSVIMPTYNRMDVIRTAIDSVVAQTYKNWELIIIDDGSTDDTQSVVAKYDDPRIRYIRNHRAKGVSGARNSGLEAAKGEIAAYLDTDNTWNENYLLLMVNSMVSRPEVPAAYCAQDIYVYNPETKEDEFQYVRFAVYNHSVMKNRNYIDLNCYMHKMDLYREMGGFSEELKRLVDWELIYRYAQKSYPYALPCRLSNYYFEKADVQITSKKPGTYQAFLDRFDETVKGEPLGLETTRYLDINGYELYSDKLQDKYKCGERKVSIIIPSYEALPCLMVCIEAVHKYTADMDYEIIIVDNNSSDIVKEYLKGLKERDPYVKVILNDYNMGFTYAVNQGIEIAMGGSDLILLNNDAIVTDGWIEELYRVKDEIPEAGLIMPRQVLIPNTRSMAVHVPASVVTRELDVTLSVHHHNVTDVDIFRQQGFVRVSFAPFFLVMITRECYNKLGLLDEKNGRHYKSDRLYCEKALENHIDIVYTPYAKAYHLLQQSTQALKEADEEMYRTIFRENKWTDIGYENVRRK